jgi:hypothetical protein
MSSGERNWGIMVMELSVTDPVEDAGTLSLWRSKITRFGAATPEGLRLNTNLQFCKPDSL